MIGMVDIEFIKKKHFQEGWSIRHLAKVLAINRITVRKVLAATEIPRYRLSVEKPAPIMGPMKGLIEQWLKEDAERPLDGIDVLGFDEIAAGKGQSYWTMICAPEGPRGPEFLHIVEGRKEKDLTPFWSWFGKERAPKVTHAVMDMWPAFRKSFLAHCPKGKVTESPPPEVEGSKECGPLKSAWSNDHPPP